MNNTAGTTPVSDQVSKIISDCEAWAKDAAEIAYKHFGQQAEVDFKSDESPVTFVDRLIESELKKRIQAKYPGDSIFGEESGVDGALSGSLWVIDPIDGTRSFISGNPLFGMLLAYVKEGVPVCGTISMPMLGEVYSGGLERGATCNGTPIHVSKQTELSNSIIYINEGEKLFAEKHDQLARLLVTGKTRRFGYDCYPHALLAAGRIDAVVDYDLKPYDYLALSAVVRAAGGIMTDWDGNTLGLSSGGAVIAAATPALHHALIDILG